MSLNFKAATRRIGAGTLGRDPHTKQADRVREQRVQSARGNARWTEIPVTRLRPHGHGLLIDAETDAAYGSSTSSTTPALRSNASGPTSHS
jgi:hypothetical protein